MDKFWITFMISTIIACSEKNELSNQEVIALLKNLEDSLDSRCELNEEGKTVFRIAIETLKNSEFPNSSDLINGQAAIDAAISADMENNSGILSEKRARIIDKHISAIPPTQPEWGKPVGDGRPLADSEIVLRLQDIKAQIGGSYAIDRAIEVLEGLQDARPEIIQSKAHWVLDFKTGRRRCSECYAFALRADDRQESLSDFCPVCGSKMED